MYPSTTERAAAAHSGWQTSGTAQQLMEPKWLLRLTVLQSESKWLNRGDPWPQGPADEGEGGFHFIDSYNKLLMKRWKRVVVCQCF